MALGAWLRAGSWAVVGGESPKPSQGESAAASKQFFSGDVIPATHRPRGIWKLKRYDDPVPETETPHGISLSRLGAPRALKAALDEVKKATLWKVHARPDHVLVIPAWKVAYFRVPKAANSAIKRVIAQELGLEVDGRIGSTKDEFWRRQKNDTARLIAPREFASNEEYRDYYSFSVVRDPLQRLLSCYRNKIVRNSRLDGSFRRRGFSKQMSLESFVQWACLLPDLITDIHLLSQSQMLCYRGAVLPRTVLQIENLEDGWPLVSREIEHHCGVTLVDLPIVNATKRQTNLLLDASLQELVRRRYAKDYTLLYAER